MFPINSLEEESLWRWEGGQMRGLKGHTGGFLLKPKVHTVWAFMPVTGDSSHIQGLTFQEGDKKEEVR